MTTRVVHLTDIHVWQAWCWPWELLGKRLVGLASLWVGGRRRRHPAAVLARAVAHAASLAPDHAVVSGDLTQTALAAEFAGARAVLEPLAHSLTVIPGNHDRYTVGSTLLRAFEAKFAAFGAEQGFPFVRDLAPDLRIIGIDPCTPDVLARGRVPEAQLVRLRELIALAAKDRRRLIVTGHYPFAQPEWAHDGVGHKLQNASALQTVLAAAEVPVVYLHGHIHAPWVHRPADAPQLLCINAGSTSLVHRKAPHGQGFFELAIGARTLDVVRHLPASADAWTREVVLAAQPFAA